MKVTLIGLITCYFILSFSTALASVSENKINPAADKVVLHTSVNYFDNYHPRQSDGINTVGLSAGIDGRLVSMHENVWLQAAYSGDYTQFKLDDTEVVLDDNFGQYSISLLGRFFVRDKLYVDLKAKHQNIDDLLGMGIAKLRPASLSGNNRNTNQIEGSLIYGMGIDSSDSNVSRQFFKVGFSRLKQDYADNNLYANLFDLTRDKAEFGLSFEISDITQFETSFEFENVDFVDDSQLDNDVYRLLVGFEWQGTGQTRLKFLVGGYKRVYHSTSDNQGFLAELEAEYAPTTYLSIGLKGSQTTTTGIVENALDTIIKSAMFSLNYNYKEHIKLTFKANASDTEYEKIGVNQTSSEGAIGIINKVSIHDYSSVSLVLQRESLKYDLLSLDYVQNKVELNCRYAF